MKKVLIIEDNEVQASLFALSVKREGHTAISVVSGEEALEVLHKEHDFAFIMLDINLEGMSGLQFLAQLREEKKFKEIPVVIITALRQETYMKEARSLGVEAYYTKPVSFDDLLKLLKKYL